MTLARFESHPTESIGASSLHGGSMFVIDPPGTRCRIATPKPACEDECCLNATSVLCAQHRRRRCRTSTGGFLWSAKPRLAKSRQRPMRWEYRFCC